MGAGDQVSRYARQLALPEVGPAGQHRLARARLVIVGAGGLGCPALQYLAGAGAGTIRVLDPDVVEPENLHRQPLYSMEDLGAFKAEAAARKLRRLNPDAVIEPLAESLDPSNVERHLFGAEIVLDCADSVAATYVLSDACLDRGIPFVSASALGLAGYVGGFCAGAPSVRAVFPEPPVRTETCAEAGVLGPVPGVLGCLQAQMALSVLLDFRPTPLGSLLRIDAKTLRFSSFRFDGVPEPRSGAYRFISGATISKEDFVVDLRDEVEAPQTATPTAIRSDVAAFGPGGPCPAADQRAVLCCRSGLRSWHAAVRLRSVWHGEIVLAALGDT